MELTLSLAHFCEAHGPTSILCTQALPISCFSCDPHSAESSLGDLEAAHVASSRSKEATLAPSSANSSFDFSDVHDSAADDADALLEDRPVPDIVTSHSQNAGAVRGYNAGRSRFSGSGEDKECVSCSIKIPATVSSRLPSGAPGSPRSDGLGRMSSPVLRSRMPLRVYDGQQSEDYSDTDDDETGPQGLKSESFGSHTSTSSFHEHTLTYVTSHSPIDPSTFSDLRRAIVRTLSGEQLPRGLTNGKIFFGDPVGGWTIAYNFRLSDKYARGGRRLYSLVALAGYDTRSAYDASRYIWSFFESIAAWITAKTDDQIRRIQEAEDGQGEERSYVPVSSFLTGRTTDPDGYPRRNGGIGQKARSLTEMTGDEKLFAELHWKFVSLLQQFN